MVEPVTRADRTTHSERNIPIHFPSRLTGYGDREFLLPYTITIDGPSGSGKSSQGATLIGRIAEEFGVRYAFFDSGIGYRAVTHRALERGIDPTDAVSCTLIAESLIGQVRFETAQNAEGEWFDRSFLGEAEVTGALQTSDINGAVSHVAKHRDVRRIVSDIQREALSRTHTVLIGRDAGTVVAPMAALKFFIFADVAKRATWRAHQMHRAQPSRTFEDCYNEAYTNLLSRDHIDMTREVDPLRKAVDAEPINNNLPKHEVVMTMCDRFLARVMFQAMYDTAIQGR